MLAYQVLPGRFYKNNLTGLVVTVKHIKRHEGKPETFNVYYSDGRPEGNSFQELQYFCAQYSPLDETLVSDTVEPPSRLTLTQALQAKQDLLQARVEDMQRQVQGLTQTVLALSFPGHSPAETQAAQDLVERALADAGVPPPPVAVSRKAAGAGEGETQGREEQIPGMGFHKVRPWPSSTGTFNSAEPIDLDSPALDDLPVSVPRMEVVPPPTSPRGSNGVPPHRLSPEAQFDQPPQHPYRTAELPSQAGGEYCPSLDYLESLYEAGMVGSTASTPTGAKGHGLLMVWRAGREVGHHDSSREVEELEAHHCATIERLKEAELKLELAEARFRYDSELKFYKDR